MFQPMLLADGLSGPNRQLRLKRNVRGRRRPGQHRLKFVAEVALLEERCLMATAGIAMPTTGFQPNASDVMYQNGVTQNVKLITIYNNSTSFIFPILEGENSATQVKNPNNYSNVLPTYDHSETGLSPNNQYAWNEEFRLYVGYTGTDGVNYFGVQPLSYVTVPVPMALWDSGRLQLVQDTDSTRSYFLSSNNPFSYHSTANEYVESISSFQSPTYVPSPNSVPPVTVVEQPLMLLYHAGGLANGIANDAPAQLTEFTIRDTSTPTSPVYPTASVSFDYDLSYLDAMYLPVALEALGGNIGGGKQMQFGYVGTKLSYDKFEATVQSFADGTLLNGYLGAGKGWPQYYTADPTTPIVPPLKIPGGNNVFQESANGTSYPTATPHSNLTSSQLTPNLPSTNGNYAVDAIANLWFSWAKYYQTKVNPGATPTPVFQKLMTASNLQTFNIQTGDATDVARARAFSQLVWTVMNAFTTVPNFPPGGDLLPTSKLMQFILGDVQTNQSLTNEVISLMRGVPNSSYSSSLWYPTPGDPTTSGLAKYNLNPFVWLVHTPSNWYGERIYAYAYSVDDAFGNILIDNTSSLLVTVGGAIGLKNANPFSATGGGSSNVSSNGVPAALTVPGGPAANSILGTVPVTAPRTLSSTARSTTTVKTTPSDAVVVLGRVNQQVVSTSLAKKGLFDSAE